ncbi:dual specificity protein phosphatase 1 [Pseudoliparis swirei]|uniref:dual specificity protein phosphatase 1 n=1 Tax=Pseudoliparis swirei TaxID=2059687 RepID=UPI0024BE0999|nr:dual specificity protein phosphatase 1 [Pseudoliparis swirei]
MHLDLWYLSRRPAMVLLEAPPMARAALRGQLGCAPGCLLLDCRSFLAFNAAHISGSTNVRFSSIVRRRARGGLGLEHIVPNEDTRARLRAGQYPSVVLLDERSLDLSQAKKDGTLQLAVAALCREPCGARVFILQGGFEAFSSEFPETCTAPPAGLSLSSGPPGSADPRCSPCSAPLYDQGGPVEILPFLYLGSAFHASRKDMLDLLGITALINVSAHCPNHFEDSFLYKSIPVEDDHKADISCWFNEAIEFIDSVRNGAGRVLVHCQAGISRSATICLAYLMRTNRVKLDEAFEFVKQRRSIISPNFSFMGQLLRFESQLLAAASCSSQAGGSAFHFPASIPAHSSAAGQLSFLHSPITTSPSC